MKTASNALYAFALFFLVPYYIGVLGRWVVYGFNYTHDGIFWLAFSALALAWALDLLSRRGLRK